jgi:hypothetical protein
MRIDRNEKKILREGRKMRKIEFFILTHGALGHPNTIGRQNSPKEPVVRTSRCYG